MIEKFFIDYGKRKLAVVKKGVGSYTARLPIRKDENGNEYIEYIRRENDTWCYNSTKKDDHEYRYTVWLKDDGRIESSRGLSNNVVENDTRFVPYAKPKNREEAIAQVLFDVKTNIHDYEKLAVPTDTINKMRDFYLRAMVKLLGYSSVDKVKYGESSIDPVFCLRDVGVLLSSYQTLSPSIFRITTENGIVYECSNVTNADEKQRLMEDGQCIAYDLQEARKLRENMLEGLSRKRNFKPDYCTGMQKVLPPREWKVYAEVLERTAKLVMSLNYDLLEDVDKTGLGEDFTLAVEQSDKNIQVEDLTKLSQEEVEKRISGLINSEEFKTACKIEDWFVLRCCNDFEDEIKENMANPRIRQGVGAALDEMLEEVRKERDKRNTTVDKNGRTVKKSESQTPPKPTVKRLDDEDPLYDRH